MTLPQIEANETELSYLLRIVATDELAIEIRQKAADRAIKLLRKTERNFNAECIFRFAKSVQPGSKYAPMKAPPSYVPSSDGGELRLAAGEAVAR